MSDPLKHEFARQPLDTGSTSSGGSRPAGNPSYAGYEYQISVTVWAALDLMLAKGVTEALRVEPPSPEDIEAALIVLRFRGNANWCNRFFTQRILLAPHHRQIEQIAQIVQLPTRSILCDCRTANSPAAKQKRPPMVLKHHRRPDHSQLQGEDHG